MADRREKTWPVPPKPIPRHLDAKALKQCLESVDKDELSKALAGRSMKFFIQGAEQLFNISVMNPYIDDRNILRLFDVDFLADHAARIYTVRWSAENNRILMVPPTYVELQFWAEKPGYYMILTYAARENEDIKEAHYQLDDNAEKTLNMEHYPRLKCDSPLPVLEDLREGHHRFVFSGSHIAGQKIIFESISVWKF